MNSCQFQPKAICIWDTPQRHKNNVRIAGITVGESDFVRSACLFDLGDRRLRYHTNALTLQLFMDMSSNIPIETIQNRVAAINQCCINAQTGEHACEFNRDKAATRNNHALRQRLKMEHFV